MAINTILAGKLISVGTSLFVVLGSGHYDLDQDIQEQETAVPATTQVTSYREERSARMACARSEFG